MVYVSFPISRPYFRGWSWNYSTLLHHCSIIFAHSMLACSSTPTFSQQCRKGTESWLHWMGLEDESTYTCSLQLLQTSAWIQTAMIRPGKLDLLFCIRSARGQVVIIRYPLLANAIYTQHGTTAIKVGVSIAWKVIMKVEVAGSQRNRALSLLSSLTIKCLYCW